MCRVTMGHLRVTVGHLRVTIGYLRSTMGYLRVLKIGHLKVFVKLREREGQGVDPGRSLKGHLWMVDGGWWYTFP